MLGQSSMFKIDGDNLPDKVSTNLIFLNDAELIHCLEKLSTGPTGFKNEELLLNLARFSSKNDKTKHIILDQIRAQINEGISFPELCEFFTNIIEFSEMKNIEPLDPQQAEQIEQDLKGEAEYRKSKGNYIN